MFGEGTPFDLQMHVLRIPVRVIPTFWLVAIFIGWNPDRLDLVFLWTMCMFASILFHELGHALAATAYGFDPHIVLHLFGGYAAFNPGRELTPGKSLMITLSGPLPPLLLGTGLLVVSPFLLNSIEPHLNPDHYEYVHAAVFWLIYINVVWSLMNLLPVLPLDGGQAFMAVLGWLGVRDSRGWALKMSVGTGALLTAGLYQLGIKGMAILFLLLTVQSLQELQSRRW